VAVVRLLGQASNAPPQQAGGKKSPIPVALFNVA
jgi:hypothetical protein